jgi:hypothetical protein
MVEVVVVEEVVEVDVDVDVDVVGDDVDDVVVAATSVAMVSIDVVTSSVTGGADVVSESDEHDDNVTCATTSSAHQARGRLTECRLRNR